MRWRVLGYSFLAENADKVRAVEIDGVDSERRDDHRPELSGRAQDLHLCEGRAHAGQAGDPGLSRDSMPGWRQGGPLQRRGLVPFAAKMRAASQQQAQALKPLDRVRAEVTKGRRAQ
jgi:phosphate transport system substrate-binding protein